MTAKELYECAKKNNAENIDIELQYQDEGGFYIGHTSLSDVSVKSENGKTFILLS